MPAFFKVYQNNVSSNPNRGKWYARPAYTGTVDERTLAREIEKRSTVHLADVEAVIASLTELIQQHIQNSERVKLTGIGTFKISFSSTPVEERDDFSPAKIYNPRVIFQEERTLNTDHTVSTRALTGGARFQELPHYSSGDKTSQSGTTAQSDTGTQQSGDNTND